MNEEKLTKSKFSGRDGKPSHEEDLFVEYIVHKLLDPAFKTKFEQAMLNGVDDALAGIPVKQDDSLDVILAEYAMKRLMKPELRAKARERMSQIESQEK